MESNGTPVTVELEDVEVADGDEFYVMGFTGEDANWRGYLRLEEK